jgi:NAD(P)-dependent dehydrogenase (short-subunit alcohol dehydrogenase family)
MQTNGKTMIVTGAAKGISVGVMEAFIERGYNVVANSGGLDAITRSLAMEAFHVTGEVLHVDAGTHNGKW